MGKSKQRILAKAKYEKFNLEMTRKQAVELACDELMQSPSSIQAKKIISLFGITAEELAEVGVTYEILRSLDGLLS